ncbi:hypothetical protein Tco_1275995 [Tanacetum coccineum]
MFSLMKQSWIKEPFENPLDTKKLESSSLPALGACVEAIYTAFLQTVIGQDDMVYQIHWLVTYTSSFRSVSNEQKRMLPKLRATRANGLFEINSFLLSMILSWLQDGVLRSSCIDSIHAESDMASLNVSLGRVSTYGDLLSNVVQKDGVDRMGSDS